MRLLACADLQCPCLLHNVGQNNVELWSLESGGGLIHPVHIHMIDGFCVAIREDSGALKPCAPELFNVPKDVMHIGCATLGCAQILVLNVHTLCVCACRLMSVMCTWLISKQRQHRCRRQPLESM